MADAIFYNVGESMFYNDGREGHEDVKAEVLSTDDRKMVVQFEDRADTTTIYFDDPGWGTYLRRA